MPEEKSQNFNPWEEDLEKLLEDLEKPPKEEPPPKRSSLKYIWIFILGILFSLVGIGVGIFILWNWLHPVYVAPVSSQEAVESTPKALSGRPEELSEHSLVLKHFLIPLSGSRDRPTFAKATVILYFRHSREALLAQKLEVPFRTIILDTLKGFPVSYWRSDEGMRKIRQILLETLRRKAPEGLAPKDVSISGYILK